MDILGPLLKMRSGNQHLIVLADWYLKSSMSISVATVASTDAATVFVETLVIRYGIPAYFLIYNDLQFLSKFLTAVNVDLGVKHLTATAYHPHTKEQVKHFKRRIVARFQHYFAKHQMHWDPYLQLLTYAYSTQIHWSTGPTPFNSIFSSATMPKDAGPSKLHPVWYDKATGANSFRKSFRQLDVLHKQRDAKLRTSQAHYNHNLNRTVSHMLQFHPLQRVFVDRPQAQMTDSGRMANAFLTKLMLKTLGPFKVISVTPDTVTLDEKGIHNTLSVDRVMVVLAISYVKTEPIKRKTFQTQCIPRMKIEPTKMLHT